MVRPASAGIGARLAEARARAGLSMAGLAQAANVSPSTIHDIEKDRRSPAIELVERLALALGVSPSWLAYGEGDGPR